MELLEKICRGKGEESDLDHLKIIADTVIETSRCGIGKIGPVALVHALNHYQDAFLEAVKNGVTEHCTYTSKTTAPCMDACPIHLDVPKYIDLIREGKFDKSLELIRTRLPLPGVLGRTCFRPCEKKCRRANMDEPIAIKSLKRFVADEALKTGVEPACSCLAGAPAPELIQAAQAATPEKAGKVAIIGAGPCGFELCLSFAPAGP